MAKIKKQVKTIDKWKKKKWFTLLAPKIFQERPLGQTLASASNLLKGRTIDVNLMTLTGNIKRQNTDVRFEVCDSQGEKALTQIKRIELLPSFIKRKVRRNRDRIDASFICVTKDGKYIRIKPMIMTASNSSRAVQKLVKNKVIEYTVRTAKNMNYDDFLNDIISYKLQRNYRGLLNQTFPIADAEIRSLLLLTGDPKKFYIPKINAKFIEERQEEDPEAEDAEEKPEKAAEEAPQEAYSEEEAREE